MAATIQAARPPEPGRRRLRAPGRATVLRLLVALASGGLLYASFPPRPLWWLAPVALAGFFLVVRGRRARAGFGYGLVFGLAFWLPLLYWIQNFLGRDFGPSPWVLLSLVCALWLGVAGAVMPLLARLPGGPVWMAAVVVATEVARTRFPFTGFPWGKIAFSQPEGLYLPLASLGGTALLTFAVVLTAIGLAELAVRLRHPSVKNLATPLAYALLPVLAGLATSPLITTEAQTGTRYVAVVQGNAPDDRVNLMNDTPILRRNHLAQTRKLIADVRAGRVPKPDLLVWPETVIDLDADPADDTELTTTLTDLGVPALIGGRTIWANGTIQNTVVAWQPGAGFTARYAKRQLVPFSEYIPVRSLAAAVTPFVADTRDMVAGTTPGVLSVAGAKVGVVICYEVAFDGLVSDTVRGGAQFVVIPTNNAWYGPGEMSYQQLAMARVAAVQNGRAVVVAATSGVSAIVQPDGSVTAQTKLFTADGLAATVPLRATDTVSVRLGEAPGRVLTVVGVVAVVIAVWRAIRRRSSGTTGGPASSATE